MRGEKRPADRGKLIGIGAVLMAALAGLSMLFGEEAAFGPTDLGPSLQAQSESAPQNPTFDYYVLALSWSPSFCEDRPDADQCGQGRRFIVHGLWPQFERGYPSDCATDANRRVPNRLLRDYQDLTASRGLLAHQWRKHGSCTGLSQEGYFRAMRAAAERVALPPPLERAAKPARLDPRVIETAFLKANPGFTRDGVTITCKSGDLAEVRICLDRDLAPRDCGQGVLRDCSQRMIDLPAPKLRSP